MKDQTELSGYWQRKQLSRRRLMQGAAAGGLGLAAASLLACGGDDDGDDTGGTSSGSGTPKDGGTFEPFSTVNSGGTFPDPHRNVAFNTDGIHSFQWTHNAVLRLNLDGLAEPDLAGMPEVSNNGLKLVFTFKDGIKFHNKPPTNGRAFTSEDAKANLARVQDPATVSTYRNNLLLIDTMETPDAKTLVLNLKEPDASILLGLTFMLFVLPKEQATGAAPLKTAADVVGTGPYTLDQYDEATGYTLNKRADGYWKPGKAHFDRARWTGYASNSTDVPVNALRAGQADYGVVTSTSYSGFLQDKRFDMEQIAFDFKGGYNLNASKPPYNDARVRQAVSLATDRRLLMQNAWDGLAVMNGTIAPGLPSWALPNSELETFPGYRKSDPDLTEAKALMSAAGQANGFEDTIIFFGLGNKVQADLYSPMLAKLGIRLNLRDTQGLATLIDAQTRGDFTSMCGVFTGQMDPHAQIGNFQSTTGSRNFGKYADPELDRQLAAARREFDIDKRKTMYNDIQRYVLKGMATNYVWTAVNLQLYAYRTYVKRLVSKHIYRGAHMAEDFYLDGKS
jgi:peptide/nickel transport system substrate-binding protein